MSVEYHPAVEAELREIRKYYDDRSPGLGKEFLDEYERMVFRIAAHPGRWMVLKGDIRRALLSRFPYVIYFRAISPNRIRITVVKHQRRHPALGAERR
jgi:plasmid stabilization system protein ParE